MKPYQLIPFSVSSGRVNMETDESLFREIEEGSGMPSIRFYAWKPWCVSIGRHQDASVVNQDFCREKGIGLVRRITGGGALLHSEELSYAIAGLRTQKPFNLSLAESYALSHGWLIDALKELGIRAEMGNHSPVRSEICFANLGAYEIHFEGKKIIGSAQRRGKRAVLQHGSILIKSDAYTSARAFRAPAGMSVDEFAEHLESRTAGIMDLISGAIALEELLSVFERAFKRYFTIT